MRRSDPLLMLADIAQVAAERPEVDEAVVRAIYQHLVITEGRQPTIQHAREYIDHLTSHVDEETIRRTLGLPVGRRRRSVAPATRKRGRPKGSGHLNLAAVREAHTAYRAQHRRQPTQQDLASELDVAVRTLQDFLKANDLRWPLEE